MAKKRTVTTLPRSVKKLFPQVTECFDSDRAVNIDVKQSDVNRSKPLDPTECAVAKAFKRETHVEAAIVGMHYAYLIKGKTAVRFAVPESIRRELTSFDRSGDFDPGTYYLIPPQPSKRLGQRKSGKKSKEASHSPKIKIHKTGRVRVLEHGAE